MNSLGEDVSPYAVFIRGGGKLKEIIDAFFWDLGYCFVLFFIYLFFETGFLFVSVVALKLSRLGWPGIEESTCFCFLNASLLVAFLQC